MKVLVLLALVAVVGLSRADVVFREAGTDSPPIEMFSEAELKCFQKEKVLHSDGKCYKLKQAGPCQNGEWLVADKEERGTSRSLVCKQMPCSRPLRVFWVEDGQCHKRSEKATLCPYLNNDLRTDSYGDGECACMEQHVRLKADVLRAVNTSGEWVGDCHPLFKRGSCPARNVLTPTYLEGNGVVGVCNTDPCAKENGRDPSGGFVRHPPKDGRCHQLGTRGPCPADQLLNVHPLTNRPQCYNIVHSAIGDQPFRCDGNVDLNTMECRKELVVKMQNMPFVNEVTGRRRKRKVTGRR